MVRRIDGEARRRALAEAVWRLVLREGLPGATVRAVATESGLATGSVRHFFGTQRELITFAMRELIDAVGARIAQASAIADPEERALTVLGEMVPLTEATRAEAFAHLQFVTQARFDPEIDEIAAESFEKIRGVCTQVLLWLREVGRVRADLDVPAAASALCAVVDGLTLELLLAPRLISVEEARGVLRDHLRSLADPTATTGSRP